MREKTIRKYYKKFNEIREEMVNDENFGCDEFSLIIGLISNIQGKLWDFLEEEG